MLRNFRREGQKIRYVIGERAFSQTGDEEVESAAEYEDLGSTRAQKVGQEALERLLETKPNLF
jgi:hypothetical protein